MKKNIKTRLEINKKVISTLQQKQIKGGLVQPETEYKSCYIRTVERCKTKNDRCDLQ